MYCKVKSLEIKLSNKLFHRNKLIEWFRKVNLIAYCYDTTENICP